MIDAADFLKWAEVFNLTGGGGGGGSVTQVNTGAGLTGGPITTTGTISLAPIADQTFLANTSGSAAVPIATPLSTFLLAANNLSDLSNNDQAFTNLGLGSGDELTIDEGDFVAGVYTLTNPCPNIIFVNAETPGNVVKLPPTNELTSFIPSQGPIFILQGGFEGIEVQDQSGAPISPIEAPGCEQFVLTSVSAPDGVWYVRSFVSTINGLSGDVVIDGVLTNLQDAYDVGPTGNINLSSGKPFSISTINSASTANAVVTPNTGANTPANYRVMGWVATVPADGNITALQYLDSVFLQPGTREVGVWIKSTQLKNS